MLFFRVVRFFNMIIHESMIIDHNLFIGLQGIYNLISFSCSESSECWTSTYTLPIHHTFVYFLKFILSLSVVQWSWSVTSHCNNARMPMSRSKHQCQRRQSRHTCWMIGNLGLRTSAWIAWWSCASALSMVC